MSLRIIYGRAGSGKSRFCLDEIKKAATQTVGGTKQVLVVPEQYTHQAEKNVVSICGAAGINGIEVLSFRRMAYRVFAEVGGLTRLHMNASGKCMLLQRIMDKQKDNLNIFSKAAKQTGFVNTLSATISEMKRYNVTPDMLKKVSNEVGDELLSGKLSDISLIYSEFENALHQKYIDTDDDLTIMAQKLETCTRFDNSQIWIDEFSGFTPQEYAVITQLMNKAARINIVLCSDCVLEDCPSDNAEMFSSTRNTTWKLLKLAKENDIKVETSIRMEDEIPYRLRESRALCHLEKNYFAHPYKTFGEATKDISIFAAVNPYSEVESAARDIVGLCREQGLRYRDVIVVTRDMARYQKLVKAVFDEYGIPFFIDSKMNINSHPLILLVVSLFEIFVRGWSYEAVFRYLKTGLLDIDRSEIDLLENYVLQWGIRGSRWTNEEEWQFKLSDKEIEKLEQINKTRTKVVAPLQTLYEEIKGKRSAKEICASLFNFLCGIGVPERIERTIEEMKSRGELTLANQYSQIWNIVMEVLDQIVEVAGDETVTIEQFEKLIATGFSEYSIGIIPPGVDQVLVGSIDRSKSHEVKALYILGVNDGVFPAAKTDEGILNDSDRANLKAMGVEIASDTVTQAFEEQYHIYTTMTTASKVLRLSYSISDHEGRAMRPSNIISRLKKLFPTITQNSDVQKASTDEECLNIISAPNPTLSELLSVVRNHMDGWKVNSIWWVAYKWYKQNEMVNEQFIKAFHGFDYKNTPSFLVPDKVKSLYGSPMHSSISKFEKFSGCPFSFFAQYGLMAKERRIFRLAAPDVGTFLHEVIDRISKKIEKDDKGWRNIDKDWCTQSVSEIVDDLIENTSGSILKSSARYKYLSDRLKRVLTRAVWTIAEHIKIGDFDPWGYEMAFGRENGSPSRDGAPSIVIEVENGERIVLEGRIDRIDCAKDEDGTYIRIIDYKSGDKDFRFSDVYYGLQIQLITYLDAAMKHMTTTGTVNTKPGGILYFKIDDPVFRKKEKKTKEEIEAEIVKQLKMKGLLLADVKLVRHMHRELTGYSHVVPAFINKEGLLGKSSVATAEQFDLLRNHVNALLKKLGGEILKGDISIKPFKNKRSTSCTYCSYMSVCQFDPAIEENKYKVLKDLKNEEFWKVLAEGGANNEREKMD